MGLQKISDAEAASDDGYKVRFDANNLVFAQGTRYLTIPVDLNPATGEMRVYMTRMSSWMENGAPCESEGTLNVNVLKNRISGALKFLERKHAFT